MISQPRRGDNIKEINYKDPNPEGVILLKIKLTWLVRENID